jgi:hypothetical protein
MSESIDVKKMFLDDFQQKVIQGRRLLSNANHRWADKLFTDLYFDIEKADWMDVQKKKQLIMIIVNSWHIYINSLHKREGENEHIDAIRYIDAYNRFFTFLSKLDDFYHFSIFFTNLLRDFIKLEDLSQEGITKFINSFSKKINEREDYLSLIELQILLMFLRKSVLPSNYFLFSMEHLGKTIFKLKPDRRALFLYVLLENINIKYALAEDSEFAKDIYKILVNRLPGELKNEFAKLGRVTINQRTFESILTELDELIHYMNNIGEYSWIIIILRFIYSKLNEYQSFEDAIAFIRKYIDFAISRNRFEIAFEIYDFLEDIFMLKTEVGYNNVLIELWVEACKKFMDLKEKKYLLQSLEKLSSHLNIPRTNSQIFHFFHTSNFIWQFKSMYFSLEPRDFWRMMFYRTLFEQKNFNLAIKIVPFLDKNLRPLIPELSLLYQEVEPLKSQIYSFEDSSSKLDPNFVIKQVILRIKSNGLISYRLRSLENKEIEGQIKGEYWNDAQINEIYDDIVSDSKSKKFRFNLVEFGQLLYLLLPKIIREVLSQFKVTSVNFIPQVYIVLDNVTIPFELSCDDNLFLLKYSNGYKIGEPKLGGISFDQESDGTRSEKKYNVLIIDFINSTYPTKWNEKKQGKELLFPFAAGTGELDVITSFFNVRDEIGSINILTGEKSTYENIHANISAVNHDVIHFVGNIIYSKWHPKDSYFMTNDKKIIKLSDISSWIKQNPTGSRPFLFFNTQIYDINGVMFKNTLKVFAEIISDFDFTSITGMISRNYPLFSSETKNLTANYYINLFNNHSQGVALLKARQQCISKNPLESMKKQVESTGAEAEGNIDRNLFAISSFILYGKPWQKL